MDYPATFEFTRDEKISRWRVIGNWILAIPHFIVLYVLGTFSSVLDVFSWFAIVFTGRLPKGIADANCMLIRYGARVTTYVDLMRSAYPPMDFTASAEDNGADPAVVVNFSPKLEDRNRLSVFFRFIPLIVVAVVAIFWYFLSFFVWILGFFAVLITGRWPEGPANFMIGVNRFGVRTSAYGALLTDEFPPLGLR